MQNITESLTNQELMEIKVKRALKKIVIYGEGMSLREAYQKGFEDAIKLISEVYDLK